MRDDREIRVLRAAGKSYLDLLAMRSGACEDAPDVVVAPADHGQVEAVLRACAEAGAAVIPFGGGTSVVGGVAPERGRFATAVSLDLGRLDAVLDVDARSRVARVAGGLRLPELDHALGAHGLRLGHLPQSYEWATVGRLRGDALGRPGVDGLRPLRRARRGGALRDAGRRAGDARRARPARPGRTCARSCSARRARSA